MLNQKAMRSPVSSARPVKPVDGQAEAEASIISGMAKPHGARAIQVLLEIATDGDSEAARVAACKELLDRGFGKVPQPVEGDGPGVTVVNVVTGVRGRD
jgi:hypothetical protein